MASGGERAGEGEGERGGRGKGKKRGRGRRGGRGGRGAGGGRTTPKQWHGNESGGIPNTSTMGAFSRIGTNRFFVRANRSMHDSAAAESTFLSSERPALFSFPSIHHTREITASTARVAVTQSSKKSITPPFHPASLLLRRSTTAVLYHIHGSEDPRAVGSSAKVPVDRFGTRRGKKVTNANR